MTFSQVHNDDNGSVVVLAPPCLWRRQRCFAAATLIAIALNGPRPVMYGTYKNRWRRGWSRLYTHRPAPDHELYKHRRAGAPSPLAATEALCSDGHHRHPLKYEATQQSTRVEATKQTVYCRIWRLSKKEDNKEKSGISS